MLCKSKMAALYVNDLDLAVTEEMLAWRFSPAGQIHSIRLCRDSRTGLSLGSAYINFRHRDDAERAIDMFNYEFLLERPMHVMWSQWEPTWKKQNVGNIILKNLDKSIDHLALYDTFSYCGRILSCKVEKNESGANGHGYIQFETAEAAELVVERFNGKLLNDTKVTIEHFKSAEQREAEKKEKKEKEKEREQANIERQTQFRQETEQGLNLHVKNLDSSVNDDHLYAAFSRFGTIRSAKVMKKNGRSRRFGFVCFESSEEAMIAMKEMNGRMWGRRPVYVSVAQTKEERQAYLARVYNMPQDLDEPALVHNQPTSTESSQVPCASDDCTKMSTPTSVDTAPVESVEQLSAVDSVPEVEKFSPEDSVPVFETAQPVDTVPVLETTPSEESVPVPEAPPAVDTTPAEGPSSHNVPETTPAPSTSEASVDKVHPDTKDESTPEPIRKRLTIYMLESSPLEDQIQMAYDYLLPLIEEFHPMQAREITRMLVGKENNFEIVNMTGDPDLLHAKVNEMDALLKAREAGYKPEVIRRMFGTTDKKKKKRKNKQKKC